MLGLPELTNDMSDSPSEKSAWDFAFEALPPLLKGDLTDSSSILRGLNGSLLPAYT
jgi:hypothetical protein